MGAQDQNLAQRKAVARVRFPPGAFWAGSSAWLEHLAFKQAKAKTPRGRGFKSPPVRYTQHKMPKTIKIQDHILVPKHVLLTKEEAQVLWQKYNITPSQMPMISGKDPAIKNLNAETGDVIKIIRNSPTEKEALFYRVVKAD